MSQFSSMLSMESNQEYSTLSSTGLPGVPVTFFRSPHRKPSKRLREVHPSYLTAQIPLTTGTRFYADAPERLLSVTYSTKFFQSEDLVELEHDLVIVNSPPPVQKIYPIVSIVRVVGRMKPIIDESIDDNLIVKM